MAPAAPRSRRPRRFATRLPPSLPCSLARLAAFGDIARAHAIRLVDSRRVHTRFRVRLAGAGSARHPLPHFTILYCPFHCRRLCTSLRQCARHDRLQFPLHSPPLSRRGGSRPPGPPAPIPLRLNPWFVLPDRVPRLWFSHRTQLAAGVARARACRTPHALSATRDAGRIPERVYAPEHTPRSRTPAAAGLRLSCSDPAMYSLASLEVLPRITQCVASNAPFPGLDGMPGPGFGHGVAIPRLSADLPRPVAHGHGRRRAALGFPVATGLPGPCVVHGSSRLRATRRRPEGGNYARERAKRAR